MTPVIEEDWDPIITLGRIFVGNDQFVKIYVNTYIMHSQSHESFEEIETKGHWLNTRILTGGLLRRNLSPFNTRCLPSSTFDDFSKFNVFLCFHTFRRPCVASWPLQFISLCWLSFAGFFFMVYESMAKSRKSLPRISTLRSFMSSLDGVSRQVASDVLV